MSLNIPKRRLSNAWTWPPTVFCRHPRREGVTWISVKGVHDAAPITALGKTFGIHLLTLEDIVNTAQRPKIEEYGGYVFIALKTMHYNEGG